MSENLLWIRWNKSWSLGKHMYLFGGGGWTCLQKWFAEKSLALTRQDASFLAMFCPTVYLTSQLSIKKFLLIKTASHNLSCQFCFACTECKILYGQGFWEESEIQRTLLISFDRLYNPNYTTLYLSVLCIIQACPIVWGIVLIININHSFTSVVTEQT